MAGKSVAGQNDASATPGTILYVDPETGSAAQSGAWTAGAITATPHPQLRAGGAAVISEASCTFAFAGQDAKQNPIAGTETVTVTAGTTKLQASQTAMLVNGDQATGQYGNLLQVTSSRKLKTSAS